MQYRAIFEDMILPLAAADSNLPAVIAQGRTCSYGLLADDIGRCISRLAEERLPPGARVLIETPDLYMFWALAFACEALGLSACAAPPGGPPPAMLEAVRPILLVTTSQSAPPPELRTIRLDGAFIADFGSRPPAAAPERVRRDDDEVFVLSTSGTTGGLKSVALSRAMLSARNAQFAAATLRADRAGVRALAPVGPWSLAGLLPAFNAWRLGGALYDVTPGAGLAERLREAAPDHIFIAPVHLQALVAGSDVAGFAADRHIFVIGGTPSVALLNQSLSRLTSNIWVCYGSTETGVVSGTHVDELGSEGPVAGRVFDWVEAEVRDPAGTVLPSGEMGELRVRLDGMANGYLGEAGGSDPLFRDGWFHPGDLASIDADRVLRIHGREDDLLHLGGAKMLPSRLEDVVGSLPGVRECAAFSAPDRDGLEIPYVAVSPGEGFDPAGASEQLARAIGRPVGLIKVDVLPRNALGKVERSRLRDALKERPTASE